MAKLKLNPDPTFTAKVAVPVPGGDAEVKMTFKYRTRDEVRAWMDAKKDESEAEILAEFVLGWDLDDEFELGNIERACKAYPGFYTATITKYLRELAGVREGN